MPRNGAGTYTLPAGNPVVTGENIESSWANSTMADLADSMTNSLARNGEGGMTAPLRVVDGSVAVPGLGFVNETTSGLYRAAAGDYSFAVLGSQKMRIRSSGVDVTGSFVATDASNRFGALFIGTGETYIYEGATNAINFRTGAAGSYKYASISASGDLSVQGNSYASGNITASGNVTAYYSDERLKTKLGDIESALDKICAIETFYYEANETAQALGYKAEREVGVSAQSVQSVFPEVVAPAPIDDQYLTVRYERLVAPIIQAIKELRAEVKALKGE